MENKGLRDGLILVVDDEPLVREMISRRLKGRGYPCIVAGNGNEAIEQLSRNNVALMLLDISMPGKSGIEVLKDIQSKKSDTVVIMITAVAEVSVAIEAMRCGAYDYLIKPIDVDTLTISVERALDRRRLILENREYQHNLEEKIRAQTEVIRNSFLNSITALAYALEAKDKYTHGHAERVTEIAVAIARELGINEENVEKIRLAGVLHDIGKIGIEETVLNKRGKLTEEEYQHVKSHCSVGAHILAPVVNDADIIDMVSHHHERFDGKGYPDELKGDQISLNAMIMIIADAYDAMTSDRPYREALSPERVRKELEDEKGKQFDYLVVDTLLKILDKGIKL